MKEKLNLVEILKDCPKGTNLYSSLFGCVELDHVDICANYPIVIRLKDLDVCECLTTEGMLFTEYDGECILFPSKEQRDWSKFKPKKNRFDPMTLNPFDRVLARICDGDAYCWFADFVSLPAKVYDRIPCIMRDKDCNMVIPYNEDTKHLVGTTEEAPEYYRYWED